MRWLHALQAQVRKAATRFTMVFTRSGWGGRYTLGLTRYDYASAVGDGRGNSIVLAVISWITRNFPSAPLRVLRMDADGQPVADPNHPLVALLKRPNPFYSGVLLWQATLSDWLVTGNAYWVKGRSAAGRPAELWWVPSRLMEPRWPEDGSEFISHYEYSPMGQPIKLPVENVVHFRDGIDPANMRKGLSRLGALLREVFTDDEAAGYTAALLRNMGVPGVIISPSTGVTITPEQAEQYKIAFMQRFTGDHRGEPLVTGGTVTASVLSFSPEQMHLKDLRRLPEERVTAVFGVPAIVAGLGAGLDRSTFANFEEARAAAYEENIIPTQRLLAEDLSTQLLPDFGETANVSIDFDLSAVRVLQDDQNALMLRVGQGYKDGILTRAEARTLVGMPAEDGIDDVFVMPLNVTTVRRDAEIAESEDMPEESLTEEPPALREAAALLLAAGERKAASPDDEVTEGDLAAWRERARQLGLADFVEAVPVPAREVRALPLSPTPPVPAGLATELAWKKVDRDENDRISSVTELRLPLTASEAQIIAHEVIRDPTGRIVKVVEHRPEVKAPVLAFTNGTNGHHG